MKVSDQRTWPACVCVLSLVCACAGGVGGDGGKQRLSSGEETDTEGGAGSDPSSTAGDSDSSPSTTASQTGSGSSTPSSTSGGTTDDGSGTAGSCPGVWRTDVPDVFVEEVVLGPDDQVLVIGNTEAAQGARLLGFDRCTGEPTLELSVDHPGAEATGVYELATDGAAVYVAGNVSIGGDPGDGYLTKLAGSPLQTVFAEALDGGDANDAIFDLTMGPGGRPWLTGHTGFDLGPPTTWTIVSEPGGGACGFAWGDTGSGTGKAVVASADEIHVLVETDGAITMLSYDANGCACACSPQRVAGPLELGTATTSIGGAAFIDGQIYVAGWATNADATDDIYGVLAWISTQGDLVDTYTFDATAANDGYIQIASDGDRIFVAGLDGWTGGSFSNAMARLDALPVPLPVDAAPVWSSAPEGFDIIPGLAVETDANGGLFVAGNIDGQGIVVRCDKSGTCG